MSLDQQIPVLMKKAQMSGDSAGSQCGLTSLLPMSCRGRAAAFARDLHSRLRNLGAAHDDNGENSWLNNSHKPTSSTRDLDTFYDFELETESPCSPVDEYDQTYCQRSPTDDKEPPFYDVDSDIDVKEQTKLMLQQPDKTKNGFRFSTVFYTDYSPVKLQPISRENGHVEKKLYSPITFEGCARQNSFDEVDFVTRTSAADTDALSLPTHLSFTADSESEFDLVKSEPEIDLPKIKTVVDTELISWPAQLNSIVDSELEFESAKSELSEGNNAAKEDIKDAENSSITDVDITLEEEPLVEIEQTTKEQITIPSEKNCDPIEIITSEVSPEKEVSPVPEIETILLYAESKEDDQDEDDRPQRIRRCSSLKTGKTPPGTPGRKKIVRFADVLGLDLADVKTFMDEIPVIPKSAYDDLTGCDFQNSPPTRTPPRLGSLTLVPLFQLPRDVTDKLERQNVCLESARVCDGVHVTICGSVRVRNLDFHKTVHVRYTMNSWKTYTDLQTTYVQGSCDGYSDRFQFILYAPCISTGQRLELAVRFQCKGQQFWDNNNGINYCFDCLALGASLPTHTNTSPLHPTLDWHPSFY